MASLHGIDVSHHQGDIDWSEVAAQAPDLRFVMSRMSHGGHGDDDLRTDSKAIHNRDGMRSAFPNTPRGFYHFLGTSNPEFQARHFHGIVGDLRPGEFVMLDVEPDADANVPVLPADHILATLEAIEHVVGRTPWLYIGLPYPNAADPRLLRFPFHFPHYHPDDEPRVRRDAEQKMRRPITVWQWGGGNEGARVAGVPPPRPDLDDRPPRIDSNQILDENRFRATLTPGLLDAPSGIAGVVTDLKRGLFGLFPLDPHKPMLKIGDHGDHVLYAQCVIFFKAGGAIETDSSFGRQTRSRISDLQRQFHMPESGEIDTATWGVIDLLSQR
jgi:Glycosyl hydrolases family 25/Putative peptidoglycan binding domain